MSDHADRIRELERAVVEAATRFVEHAPEVNTLDVTNAVDALLSLRAETCPECGGSGKREQAAAIGNAINLSPCPAGCDHGRRVTP